MGKTINAKGYCEYIVPDLTKFWYNISQKQKIMFILYKTGLVLILITILKRYIGTRVWLTMSFPGQRVHQTSI